MHRRNGRCRGEMGKRKTQMFEMRMHYIELIGTTVDLAEHREMISSPKTMLICEPQCLWTSGFQRDLRGRVARSEERHFVAARHQRFREPCDHTLSASIEFR